MPKEFYNTRLGKKILLHAGDDAVNKAYAYFDADTVVISDPSGNVGIMIAKDFGIGIQGPLTLLQNPEEIRVASLWKLNPLVTSALPSTLYTPVPWLRRSIPQSSKELMKGITEVSALI